MTDIEIFSSIPVKNLLVHLVSTYLSPDIFFKVNRNFIIGKFGGMDFSQIDSTFSGHGFCQSRMGTASENS